jgi:signal transduction histidine kinase
MSRPSEHGGGTGGGGGGEGNGEADAADELQRLRDRVAELDSLVRQLREQARRDEKRLTAELAVARLDAQHARSLAEQANVAKSQFLAMLSHELRTPLNAIDGYAELMELGIHGPLTDGQREALRRLRRAEKRLLSLTTDILNFARLEAGHVELELRDVAVADLFERVAPLFAPQAESRGQQLMIDHAPDGLTVHADADRAEQILLNLLANAVKFTPAGGRIGVSARAVDSAIHISVTDTGSGIPADRFGVIFEPFVQVTSGLVRDHGGVGLGLSISRDLAHAMSGDIVVESRLGHGSTFTLVLPAGGDSAG